MMSHERVRVGMPTQRRWHLRLYLQFLHGQKRDRDMEYKPFHLKFDLSLNTVILQVERLAKRFSWYLRKSDTANKEVDYTSEHKGKEAKKHLYFLPSCYRLWSEDDRTLWSTNTFLQNHIYQLHKQLLVLILVFIKTNKCPTCPSSSLCRSILIVPLEMQRQTKNYKSTQAY